MWISLFGLFFFVATNYILPLSSFKTNHENKVPNPIRVGMPVPDSNDGNGTKCYAQRKCERC
jgi:hypothetical protein